MMVACAAVSIATAIISFRIFPLLLDIIGKFELNSEGNLEHVQNYLVEIVEMIKESIMLVSEDMVVLRGNEASKTLFGHTLVGANITELVHPDDLRAFKEVVNTVLGSYAQTPFTLEYRVKRVPPPPVVVPRVQSVDSVRSSARSVSSHLSLSRHKVYCLPEDQSMDSEADTIIPRIKARQSTLSSVAGAGSHSTLRTSVDAGFRSDKSFYLASSSFSSVAAATAAMGGGGAYAGASVGGGASSAPVSPGIPTTGTSSPTEYIWIESTFCKGMRLDRRGGRGGGGGGGGENEDLVFELKVVSRNIEDRKHQERNAYLQLVKDTEERGRINAAKLRYITCIAHDLKAPLHSFCFSLDLLQQSRPTDEQHELLGQATVAVDLMKLTISQTMDISKVLTGAKLQPRRTTVYISSIIQRVSVIM